jgi:two-component system chemotaxis response regulator CheY
MKFLVVDSNHSTHISTLRLLDMLRIRDVSEAFSGTEAINKLHTETFDFALIELTLEDMPGTSLIRYIRNDSTLNDLSLIGLHRADEEQLALKAIDLGCDATIERPFSAGVLQQQIQNIIENK